MSADDRTQAALEKLASRYGLGSREREQLGSLLMLLARDPRAPTSVRDPGVGVGVHLADSLAALDLGAVRDAKTIADVGAGAGFPGLPLAVARSGSEVRLIESQSRKCAFLETAVAALGIENARVVCARAEEWREGTSANDVVVARAVGP